MVEITTQERFDERSKLAKLDAMLTLDYCILADIIEESGKINTEYLAEISETKAHFSAVRDLMAEKNTEVINPSTGFRPSEYGHLLTNPRPLTTYENVSLAHSALSRLNDLDASLTRQELNLPLELLGEWVAATLEHKSTRTPLARYDSSQ